MKGKEYYTNGILKYEGTYLNGEKNGNGKEYYYSHAPRFHGKINEKENEESIIFFEGEYLNGKKWNGKGFDKNGEIIFELKDGTGKCQEYNNEGVLIFEGEYINGEKHGKCKEYSNKDELIFEGEYINGKRNGKGKGHIIKDMAKFEGEYLNDKEWNGIVYDNQQNILCKLINGNGFIKEYNYKGELNFESEYINGNMQKVKIYCYDGKLKFEGEYKNGKRNGKGKEYLYFLFKEGNQKEKDYRDGELIFEGEYLNGEKWNGKVKNYYYKYYSFNRPDGEYVLVFEGEYLNGKRHGKGKEYYDWGPLKFEGEYLYNYKRKGKLYIGGNLEFIGEYSFNKKWNGKGYHREYKIDYNGLFGSISQNKCDINESYVDKVIYELKNGNGEVKEYDDKGELIFEGVYINGKRHGKGKEYNYNKGGRFLIFEGEYINGKRWNGKGKEYQFDGKLRFEGEYKNGERWNGKTIFKEKIFY